MLISNAKQNWSHFIIWLDVLQPARACGCQIHVGGHSEFDFCLIFTGWGPSGVPPLSTQGILGQPLSHSAACHHCSQFDGVPRAAAIPFSGMMHASSDLRDFIRGLSKYFWAEIQTHRHISLIRNAPCSPYRSSESQSQISLGVWSTSRQLWTNRTIWWLFLWPRHQIRHPLCYLMSNM